MMLWMIIICASGFISLVRSDPLAYQEDALLSVAEGPELGIRLPKDLTPLHYLIRLKPFLNGNFSINGHVEITFKVIVPSSFIVLHIKDIITHNDTVKVTLENSTEELNVTNQRFDKDKEFYIATLDDPLEEGQTYVIQMKYQAYLNDVLRGFYRSSYVDEQGSTKYVGTTQFQATDARRAFPCFDEPEFKAKFSIEMIREASMTAVSNMPLLESTVLEDQTGWVLDRFETSLPMSTYLVAFIVSDFAYQYSTEQTRYKFGVMSRRDLLHQTAYALEIGPKIMTFFEEFFEVPFPLPKLDMAAVPDFSAGGMENWGLIIYRESGLLHDKDATDVLAKRRTSLLVSHELAHMWFGDLVTPVWWTDLWLNEGFASYVEYLGMNSVDPAMKFLEQVVALDFHSAMEKDSLESSHPISVEVGHPDEINEIFDSISYQKGASIIRMMSFFLTEETFRKALNKYLTDFSTSNAEQDDLWRYLTDEAHLDGTLDISLTVKEIMDTWTLQMGFPVLTVRRDIVNSTLHLEQERFLMTQNPSSEDTHDYKWWIPITMTSSSNSDFTKTSPVAWMMPSEAEKTLEYVPSTLTQEDWIIFNVKSSGYFRVNYDTENWNALTHQLREKNDVIDSINRAQILDDAFNLARAGQLSYDIPLGISSYVKEELEYVPLITAINSMSYLKKMFASFDEYAMLKNFFLSLMVPQYDLIGFDDKESEPEIDQLKRIEILRSACSLGHQPCVDQSMELFTTWMQDPENDKIISPNLRKVVYCTGVAEGGEEEWDFVWGRYDESDVATERDLLLYAMGCSKDPETLLNYLEASITPGKGIRKQDTKLVISAVAENDLGKEIAWEFLQDRWTDISSYFGSVSFTLTGIVESITKYLNTEDKLEELLAFQLKYEGAFLSADQAVQQAEENVRTNVQWMKNYNTFIVQWLKENGFEEHQI